MLYFSEKMSSRKFNGVYVCICVSLVSIPVMCAFLSNQLLSKVVPQYAVQYGILVACLGVYIHLLRPSGDFWNFETRGSVFYYLCCLFTTLSAMQLTVHGSKFAQNKPKLLTEGQGIYLKTDRGISSEIAYCISSYILCLMMISRMDKYFSARNLALYWSGATLTNELVGVVSMVLNRNLKPEYSTFIHLLYFLVALWCLYHFLHSNQRLIPCKLCVTSYRPLADTVIIMLLCFSIAFTTFRALAALNIQRPIIKRYTSIEPMLLDPSKFVRVWIAISCLCGIPCCFMAISYLNRLICTRNINMALLHAGCIMQGTLMYVVFAVLSAKSEAKYRPSWRIAVVALALNFIFALTAHLYVLRCVRGGPKLRITVCGYDDCNDEDALGLDDDLGSSENSSND